MIRVTDTLYLSESDIEESFIRAGGPGGQNVNKVATAVQLRFDARRAAAIDDDVFARLRVLAGSRMTRDGVIVLSVNQHRTQDMNRKAALDRLVDLVYRATLRPKKRRPTRPTLGSKRRRLDGKRKRAVVKQGRGKVRMDD